MVRTNQLRAILIIGLITLMTASQTEPVSAGTDVWTSLGPEGGIIYALAIDPSTPGTLYVGTRGVFKSINSGGTWSAVNTGLPNADVTALAIDPATPGTLYAGVGGNSGTGGGVFKSTDGGGNWGAVNTGLTDIHISALAINPETPTIIYSGTWGGVFKSTDGGGNWSAVNTGLTNTDTYVRVLVIDPATPTTIYAGTDTGVFKSMDGGGNWSAVNTGLTNTNIFALAIDPVTPSTLYVGTSYNLFKTTNSGGTWNRVDSGLTNPAVNALAIDPATPGRLYVGIYGSGVFKSTNGGGNWSAFNTGLTNTNVNALAIDPATPTTIYAETYGSGVFVRGSGGGGVVYSISGNAGVGGASLTYTDGTYKTATADGLGDYSFSVSSGWSGTVMPYMTSYAFSPASRTYSSIQTDQTGQNYSAALITTGADEISDPRIMSTVPYQDITDTTLATQASDDPELTACDRNAGLASVWYQYSPSSTREVSLDTYGSNYDTLIGVWSGAPGSLTPVACNDNAGGTLQSFVTFAASAGTDYYIGISQYNGSVSGLIVSGGTLAFHATTFADAKGNAWYWKYVEGFYAQGITSGCATGPFRYCPDRAVTRAEMAVFLLRAMNGASYTSAPSETGMFSDVPVLAKEWMQPWIEQFYVNGMTSGCAASPLRYCPERAVTRAEMAVFVLRAVHGASYTPPAVTGIFSDVPVAGKEWMQAWIEQFYREGITTGCAASPLRFCPEQSVTRAEMATFIDRAFGFAPLP